MQTNRRDIFRNRKKIQGLTVLELLIVLAAVGVVLLVAVPGSDMLLNSYRMKQASSSIISGLELARTEASARSSAVVVCPSSNGHTCRSDANWDYGWLVFSDGNGNGTVQDIELIRSFEAPSRRVHIMASGAVQQRAAFTATGLVPHDQVASGQFQICLDGSDVAAAEVKVDADGWVQRIRNPGGRCSGV